MEIYRKYYEGEVLSREGYHQRCRDLAGFLMGLLDLHSRGRFEVDFEGPFPLSPDSANVSGHIKSFRRGLEQPLSDPYHKIVIDIPDGKGGSQQRVEIETQYPAGPYEMKTGVAVPAEKPLPFRRERDPKVFDQIAESIQKYSFKPR